MPTVDVAVAVPDLFNPCVPSACTSFSTSKNGKGLKVQPHKMQKAIAPVTDMGLRLKRASKMETGILPEGQLSTKKILKDRNHKISKKTLRP